MPYFGAPGLCATLVAMWFLAYNRSSQPLAVSASGRMVDGSEFTYADDGDPVAQRALQLGTVVAVPITFNPATATSPPVDAEALAAAREVVSRNGGTWTPTPMPWLPDWSELTGAVAELLEWYRGGEPGAGSGGGGVLRPGVAATAVAAPLGPLLAAIGRRGSSTAKIVVLGADIAAGAGATNVASTSWVARLRTQLQVAYPSGGVEPPLQSTAQASASPYTGAGVQVINGAQNGVTSGTYVGPVLLTALDTIKPAGYVHMIGTADATPGGSYVAPEQFESNVRASLDQLDVLAAAPATPAAHLFVHGFRRSSVSQGDWGKYLSALRKIEAERSNVQVVDLSGAWETTRYLAGDPFDLVSGDPEVPTDTGHWLLAELLSRALRLPGGSSNSGGGGGGSASAAGVSVAPLPAEGLNETNVQAALEVIASRLTAHMNASGAKHSALNISVTPTGTLTATTVQAALAELDSEMSEAVSGAAAASAGFTAHTNTSGAKHAAGNLSFEPVGSLGATTVQAALEELDAEKVARLETRTVRTPSVAERLALDYTVTTSDPNLREVVIQGTLRSWFNEWGALRGRNPYPIYADALVRAIVQGSDFVGAGGSAFEIVDRTGGTGFTVWGRKWDGGALVRNGHTMADTWVRPSPSTPIPSTLPPGTIVRTLGVV